MRDYDQRDYDQRELGRNIEDTRFLSRESQVLTGAKKFQEGD